MIETGAPTAALCSALLFAPLLTGLALYLVPGPRLHAWAPVAVSVFLLSVLVALSLVYLDSGGGFIAMGGHPGPLGIELQLDALALAMLWLVGAVALGVSIHATASLPAESVAGAGFRLLWMPLWSALNGLFLAADAFNIYVLLELVSLTAISLVTLQGGSGAIGAASRYLLFALGGSTFYLLGVAVLYADTGLLAIRLLEASPPRGPVAALALGCMTLGVAMKGALFPVHGWLPPAHARAPSPASALLSGVVVTAGAYLVLRLWLGPFHSLASGPAAQFMGAAGAAGMIYGSLQALRQTRLKLVVAYSTVAQLGYLLLAIPLSSIAALQGATLHAVSHGLAKAAFFLAAGNVIRVAGDDRLESLGSGRRGLVAPLAVMALAGASLAGIPPTGGFLAKWWLASAALASGQWWWAATVALGGLLAAAYVGRVLQHGLAAPAKTVPGAENAPAVPRAMSWPPLALALAALALGLLASMLAPWLPGGVPASSGP